MEVRLSNFINFYNILTINRDDPTHTLMIVMNFAKGNRKLYIRTVSFRFGTIEWVIIILMHLYLVLW